MIHVFYIDPLAKLNIKKDSSLMMALSLKNRDKEAYLLFEEDFYVSNTLETKLKVYKFKGNFKEDGYYIDSFELCESLDLQIGQSVTIHMRIDPPYDQRYQRYLWMLDYLSKQTSAQVLNHPLGIM